MATVAQIRARLRTEALEWKDVHVSAPELNVQDLIDWAEELGEPMTPCGHGYGRSVAGNGRRSKTYEREHLPFCAILNADDEDDAKTRKIVGYFNRLFPQIAKSEDVECAALRLIHEHALFLPLVRTSRYCDTRAAQEDREPGIALYALDDEDIQRQPGRDEWKAAKLAELVVARQRYNEMLDNIKNKPLQKKLRGALDAWRKAGTMLAEGRADREAGYAAVKVWRAAMRKRLGLKGPRQHQRALPLKKAA